MLDNKIIDWGVAMKELEGEDESGDMYLVKAFTESVLVAVTDGLGHGSGAAIAARAAITTLEVYAHESVISLVELCHKALKRTRGAVMSLASFNAPNNTMTWLGVGNVEGVLLRARPDRQPASESLLKHGGIVGYNTPRLHAKVIPVTPGDTLIFATDGIHNDFTNGLNLHYTPQQIADVIFERYSKGHDDALVLVVRYLGDSL